MATILLLVARYMLAGLKTFQEGVMLGGGGGWQKKTMHPLCLNGSDSKNLFIMIR